MRYIEFQEAMEPFKVFSIIDIEKRFTAFSRMNLVNWQNKGYIINIRRGWYCFKNNHNFEHINWLAANLIYKPSYISTYSAFSYYNLIPEAVYDITSITTKRTNIFNTEIGSFSYKKVKNELFGFGHVLIDLNEGSGSGSGDRVSGDRLIVFAELEKAILDFFYLYHQYNSLKEIELLRFDEYVVSSLNIEKLEEYLHRFKSIVLEKRINRMLKIYK